MGMDGDTLIWTNERRRLVDLIPWRRNPRKIRPPQVQRLVESVQEFGQVETLAIGPDNDIYNGHQRLVVLMERYGPDYEVDVRVSSRPLSEKEREKLTVYLHKGAAGEWDFEMLATEFAMPDLLAWGFEPGEVAFGMEVDETPDIDFEIDKNAKPKKRGIPIDLIFTHTHHASCCIAVNAGLKYGLQSTREPCLYAGVMEKHK